MTNAIAVQPQDSMRLRARSYMAFVLTPSQPTSAWLAQLDKWSENSPNFFASRPIILDLAGAAVGGSEIASLITDLTARGIRIMALEGVNAIQLSPSLPPVLKRGRSNGGDMSGAADGANITGPQRHQNPLGPIDCLSQWRRNCAWLGVPRRRNRCRWLNPHLWRAARTSHGRFGGEPARADFLQQERSRARLGRRLLLYCRANGRKPSQSVHPVLA